jgi:serine/threonine protein kinase
MWLSDKALNHLERALDRPDLSGTKYELLEEIGRGGMGAVYRARDAELDREVALKVLHQPEKSAGAAARMLREARILARLEHPSIVPVHDVGTLPDGRVFYVMKRVEGRRLDQFRATAPGLADLLRVFEKICEAAAFAHAQGIIHRDLKPENIMVGAFGEALVMDWGVAKVLADGARTAGGAIEPAGGGTASGTVIGTPGYMAPEQERGEVDQIDARADVYALGAILTFLLEGRSDVPRPLRAIAAKAMAADREKRYPGAKDLGADVARFAARLPVSAYRENVWERAVRLFVRFRTPILLVLAYLVMRSLVLFFTGR